MKISAKVVIYSVLLMLTSSSRHFARAFRNSRSRIDKIGLCLSEMRQLASTNIDDDVEIHTADALPSSFNSKFLQTLLERGFIHQCTDFKTLDEKLQFRNSQCLFGFRCDGFFFACGLIVANYDLAALTEVWP